MNKFITDKLGGHPLNLEDFGFLQDALAEGINRHGDTITSFDLLNEAPIVILRGVGELGGNALGAGSAWVNPTFGLNTGEFMEVEALPAVPDRSIYNYVIVETPDPVLDPTTYLDTSTPDVHLIRKLVPQVAAGIASVNSTLAFRYQDQISKALFNNSNVFTNLLNAFLIDFSNNRFLGGWTSIGIAENDPAAVATKTLEYKRTGNFVEFRGDYTKTGGSYINMFDVPADARPSKPITRPFSIGGNTGASPVSAHIRILATGEIQVITGRIATTDFLNFDNLSFWV